MFLSTSLKYEMVNFWNKLSHTWRSESWSLFACSGRGVKWRVSKFIVFNKWNFTRSTGAIWKFNPLFFGWIVSTQLSEHHVSSLFSSGGLDMVMGVGNWVCSLTGWVKFSLFLLGYLMLLVWNNNVSVNNWIINFKIGSSSGIRGSWGWGSVNSFPAFAGGDDSVRKILSQSDVRKGKILGTFAIW